MMRAKNQIVGDVKSVGNGEEKAINAKESHRVSSEKKEGKIS